MVKVVLIAGGWQLERTVLDQTALVSHRYCATSLRFLRSFHNSNLNEIFKIIDSAAKKLFCEELIFTRERMTVSSNSKK